MTPLVCTQAKGWFPKGRFWRMFLDPKNRNEGTKTERYQKPEQKIGKNNPKMRKITQNPIFSQFPIRFFPLFSGRGPQPFGVFLFQAGGPKPILWQANVIATFVSSHDVFGRMQFFAYNWKLPAYSGEFLLTDNFCFFTYNWSFLLTILVFLLTVGVFCLQWESASNKGLKGLYAKKPNCKQKKLQL